MTHMPMDKSTGFVSEDELVQLAEPPEVFAGADAEAQSYTAGPICTGIITASAISSLAGDLCPTTACSDAC